MRACEATQLAHIPPQQRPGATTMGCHIVLKSVISVITCWGWVSWLMGAGSSRVLNFLQFRGHARDAQEIVTQSWKPKLQLHDPPSCQWAKMCKSCPHILHPQIPWCQADTFVGLDICGDPSHPKFAWNTLQEETLSNMINLFVWVGEGVVGVGGGWVGCYLDLLSKFQRTDPNLGHLTKQPIECMPTHK